MKKDIVVSQTAGNRNYGIDALRLIAMFMVVVLHVLGQGGVLYGSPSLTVKGETYWSIEIACYCAVNVFAIISGYVGVNAKHKWSSLFLLCFQLTLYACIITSVALIVGWCNHAPISWENFVHYLFPSATSMWYFAAYFCLFFFMPMLNAIIQNVPQKTLKVAGMFVFIVFCCWTQLFTRVSNLGGGYSVIWLVVLYVVGGYMSKYKPMQKLSVTASILSYLACVAVTVLSRILIGNLALQSGRINILVSYTSPTIFLAAIFLVHAFANMRVSQKATKLIAHTSPMAFGVYLIHCHPYLYDHLKGLFAWIVPQHICLGVFYVFAVAFAIFAVCLALDWLRLQLFKACKTKEFATRLETALEKIRTRR